MKRLLLFCVMAPLACSVGSAALIYNNGAPNQASADSISDLRVAEDMVVSSAGFLTSFEFWDVEAPGAYNGSISWFLFTNAAGTPGTVIAQGNASTGAQITRTATANTNVFGFAEFDDVVNMTGSLTSGSLTVGAGTYWLGLHDGLITNTVFQDFYWETTANNASTFGEYQDLTSGPAWVSTLQEHAFNVSGTLGSVVPEPGTWVLMSAGLAGLALLRRKTA